MTLPLPTRGLTLWSLGTSLLVSTRFSDALRASPGSLSLSGAAQQQHQHYGASSRLPPSCHARHDYSTARRRARNAANTAPCAFSGSKLDSSRLRCCPGRLLVMSSSSGDGAMEGGVDGRDDEEDENEMATVVEGEVVTSAQELGGGEEELKAVTQEASAMEKGMKGKKKRRSPRLEGEKLRDELMGREKQEEDAVLEVNTQFYRGRAYKEIDELKEVWDKSDLSECIRSVGSVLKGYNNIIEEYKTDFVVAKKNDLPGLRPFKIRDLKVQTCGTLAWITCVEDMRNPYKPYPKTVQLVTNVFRKTSNGWKLTRHHASDRDVPAGKGGTGGSSSKSLSGSVGGKQPGTSDGQGGMLSHFVDENGQVTELSARMFRVADGEIRPVDISELTGDASGGGGDEDDIDLSKGEWISIGDEDVSGGNIPPFLKKLITDKVKAAVNKGDAGAIMRSPESFKKKLTRELKDELGGGLKNGSDKHGGIGSTNSSRRHGDDDEEEEEAEMKQARELTRETVDAVRQLAQAGKISEKEKRLLLADVILNASSEGPSITEVAFQVLVGGGEEAGRDFDANGCEEFVDQCKALAVQLAQEQSKRRPWWKFWAWFRR